MAKKKNFSAEFLAFQKKRKDPLSYPREMYRYPDTARQIPNPIQEYRKLRNVAMNRIRKLEKAGFGQSETVTLARLTFEALPKNLTPEEAAERLPWAARFITSKQGTVGGMKAVQAQRVQTLQDRGFDFVTDDNVDQFYEFMDYLQEEKKEDLYYVEEEEGPREGRKVKRRRARVNELGVAFENWRKINNKV